MATLPPSAASASASSATKPVSNKKSKKKDAKASMSYLDADADVKRAISDSLTLSNAITIAKFNFNQLKHLQRLLALESYNEVSQEGTMTKSDVEFKMAKAFARRAVSLANSEGHYSKQGFMAFREESIQQLLDANKQGGLMVSASLVSKTKLNPKKHATSFQFQPMLDSSLLSMGKVIARLVKKMDSRFMSDILGPNGEYRSGWNRERAL